MSFDSPEPISIHELNASTLAALVVSLILGLPLLWIQPLLHGNLSLLPIVLASGLFWGIVSILAFHYGWDIYYKYFFPTWVQRFSLLNSLSYALISLGIAYLSLSMMGNYALVFLVIGGIEGVLEHVIGIYNLGILEKVPWLKGLPVPNLLLFSFFEYVAYWAIVLWLALGFRLILR
jgi:hypothetical protein